MAALKPRDLTLGHSAMPESKELPNKMMGTLQVKRTWEGSVLCSRL